MNIFVFIFSYISKLSETRCTNWTLNVVPLNHENKSYGTRATDHWSLIVSGKNESNNSVIKCYHRRLRLINKLLLIWTLGNKEEYAGGLHSSKAAFTLRTQPPRVRFLAFTKKLKLQRFINSSLTNFSKSSFAVPIIIIINIFRSPETRYLMEACTQCNEHSKL